MINFILFSLNPTDSFSFIPNSFLPSIGIYIKKQSFSMLFSHFPHSFIHSSISPIRRKSKIFILFSYHLKRPIPCFLSFSYSPSYVLPSGHSKIPFPSILLFFQSPLYLLLSSQIYSPKEKLEK